MVFLLFHTKCRVFLEVSQREGKQNGNKLLLEAIKVANDPSTVILSIPERAILTLYSCNAKLLLINQDIGSPSKHKEIEASINNIIRVSNAILSNVPEKLKKLNNYLEKNYLICLAHKTIKECYEKLHKIRPGRNNIELLENAIRHAEMAQSHWTSHIGSERVIALADIARLKASVGEKSNNAHLIAEACEILERCKKKLGKSPKTVPPVIYQYCAQAAASHVLLTQESGKYREVAISSALTLLKYEGAPIEAMASATAAVLRMHTSLQDWQSGVDLFELFLAQHNLHLKNNLSLEEARSYTRRLWLIGETASFCYSKLGNPNKSISSAESCRSIFWKHALRNLTNDEVKAPLTDLENVYLNPEVIKRVNVILSVSEAGFIWTILWSDGKLENTKTYEIQEDKQNSFENTEIFWKKYIYEYVAFLSWEDSIGSVDFFRAKDRWNTFLKNALQWAWDTLFQHIHQSLLELQIPLQSHVHLVPIGFLSSFPCQSCGYVASDGEWRCFSDYWIVSQSDSLCHEHFKPEHKRSSSHQGYSFDYGIDLNSQKDISIEYLGITDPNGDLGLLENPAKTDTDFRDLAGVQASKGVTLDALSRCKFASIFCHGSSDFAAPFSSNFVVSNREKILIEDIFKISLKNKPIIFLGTCESGVNELTQYNEAFSIATALLWSGAKAVVATNWPVRIDIASL